MKPNQIFKDLLDPIEVPKDECISFYKVREKYGVFHNMAYAPIEVRSLTYIPSKLQFNNSEGLYQCLKYSEHPEIQQQIIEKNKKSPMIMKRFQLQFKDYILKDWFDMHYFIMHWCIEKKYTQCERFRDLLNSTRGWMLVEGVSAKRMKDPYGAFLYPDGIFRGINILGKLLMDVRDNKTLDEIGIERQEFLNIKFKKHGWKTSDDPNQDEISCLKILGKPI